MGDGPRTPEKVAESDLGEFFNRIGQLRSWWAATKTTSEPTADNGRAIGFYTRSGLEDGTDSVEDSNSAAPRSLTEACLGDPWRTDVIRPRAGHLDGFASGRGAGVEQASILMQSRREANSRREA